MIKKIIYLDYASTTPIDYGVNKIMFKYCFTPNNLFGNATTNFHYFNNKAQIAIKKAKKNIAKLINADVNEIIFTSGATESNNLLLKGLINNYNKNHIITTNIEHKSILNTCKYLQSLGIIITYLSPDKNGIININNIINSITKNTFLITIAHVNNEIGTIQNIKKISEICKQNNIIFHIDAAQSLGKIPINVKSNNIDCLSASSHKIYGPKGIGFLYLKKKYLSKISPQILGGEQQYNIRSGTLPVHLIVGMAKACSICYKIMYKEQKRILVLNNILRKGLSTIKIIKINNKLKYSVPNIINISFKKINNYNLIKLKKKIAFSYKGSSCNKDNLSHVLLALKINNNLITNSIRISIGRYTSMKDIFFTIKHIYKSII